MKRAAYAVSLGLALASLWPSVALADVTAGRTALTSGDYPTALRELTAARGRGTPAERIVAETLSLRAWIETGAYPQAEKAARTLAKATDPEAARAGVLALGEVLRLTGRHQEAKRELEALVKARPDDRRARHQLVLTLHHLGQLPARDALLQRSLDEFDAQTVDLDKAEELYLLAQTAQLAAQYELANDSYQEVANLDPSDTTASVAWAYLFMQKYASELAAKTLEEAFKINPNLPDAHAAMAAVQAESSYDLAVMRHHIEKALAVNPKHERTLMVRAALEIDQNQWAAALATCDQVLATNPESTEAIGLRATVAWLRDDLKTYEAEKARAFAINPAYADLYRQVARSAVREHRYREAIDLEQQAVALRPDYYEAMSGVGLGYLRLGLEKEGIAWLDKSWQGDKYNVRTFNTRELFKQTIPKEYVFSTSKSFRIRYHKEEQPLLSRYLEPVLERAFADMVKRYGFTPKTPVILELYAAATDYSVRTVGLPNLGALGVCFGQVITAMSPSNGDINWGMVLWHELAHVFAIQLSNSRVPRWFTEGLSEYETLIARPEWRRENDADLYAAMQEGAIPSVVDLNSRFMVPDQNAVVVAYYMSAVTIEFIVQRYGFPKIVDGLKLFGKGKETPEVITSITGGTVAAFDAAFRSYLDQRLAPYKGTFHVPSVGDDLAKLEIDVDAAPKSARARARLALGHYAAGDAASAERVAKAALALDKREGLALYVLAEAALRGEQVERAETLYREMIGHGHDSFDVRVRLATIAQHKGDHKETEAQLCKAKALNPENSYPYEQLAELYAQTGRITEARRALETYAILEQMQFAPVRKLTLDYAGDAQWAAAKRTGELALYINPFDADVLLALGRAYQETGDAKQALFTFDSALLIDPPLRRPALAQLGRARALAALGRTAEAKTAVAAALKTEPANADALALKAKL